MIGILVDKLAAPIFNLIDDLFTTEEEKAEARLKLTQLAQEGRLQETLAQIKVNLKEAEHKSIFVAGWRPFVGWTCGVAFAYTFVFQPFMTFIAVASGIDMSGLPELDLGMMLPILGGMLGLGYLRTREKEKGVDTST